MRVAELNKRLRATSTMTPLTVADPAAAPLRERISAADHSIGGTIPGAPGRLEFVGTVIKNEPLLDPSVRFN